MAGRSAKRSREKRCDPPQNSDLSDDLSDDDELEELRLRPAYWPRRSRSKKIATNLELFKESLLRQVPLTSDGKKVKVSQREVLNALFGGKPMNGTPQEMLALIELLEELHPSPNPTLETLLDLDLPCLD